MYWDYTVILWLSRIVLLHTYYRATIFWFFYPDNAFLSFLVSLYSSFSQSLFPSFFSLPYETYDMPVEGSPSPLLICYFNSYFTYVLLYRAIEVLVGRRSTNHTEYFAPDKSRATVDTFRKYTPENPFCPRCAFFVQLYMNIYRVSHINLAKL